MISHAELCDAEVSSVRRYFAYHPCPGIIVLVQITIYQHRACHFDLEIHRFT